MSPRFESPPRRVAFNRPEYVGGGGGPAMSYGDDQEGAFSIPSDYRMAAGAPFQVDRSAGFQDYMERVPTGRVKTVDKLYREPKARRPLPSKKKAPQTVTLVSPGQVSPTSFAVAGGGGANAAGQNGQPANGGYGGDGATNSFLTTDLATSLSVGQVSGPAVYFSGGGGGGGGGSPNSPPLITAGPGGLGGGGLGYRNAVGSLGSENTGGGGGGGGRSDSNLTTRGGGNGGKGIVIIRYDNQGSNTATGGTISTTPSYVIHTFTGDGTFATNSDFGDIQTFSGYSIN